MTVLEAGVFGRIQDLWTIPKDDPWSTLLPTDPVSLRGFHETLRRFVATSPRSLEGEIHPGATIRGEVVGMGPGSVIEAGAVIHDSCKLVLGPGSRVRSGAVLRDEVVVGPDCLIGVHCEVERSLIRGPGTTLGHSVYLADSIVGASVEVGGNVMVANTTLKPGRTVRLKMGKERIDTGRTHLGALIGDGVRFGASTTLCPGCIVERNLTLPPGVVLHGTIDRTRRDRLMNRFFRVWDSE
jgi:NDP-sugar pyrophosphorylase family protein